MDIVAIEGEPIAKRGKPSGKKAVFRCPICYEAVVVPSGWKFSPVCHCGQDYEHTLKPIVETGKLTRPYPSVHGIRDYVLKQLEKFEL
jgi:nicotinic acid phosphoribosyltransferase